jgi:hypothetical protein
MSRRVEAEYPADENVLRLNEPLAGVRDHPRVVIEITDRPETDGAPWLALAGSLSEAAGRELARAVRDEFGRDLIVP